jgi:hypothetical protein
MPLLPKPSLANPAAMDTGISPRKRKIARFYTGKTPRFQKIKKIPV